MLISDFHVREIWRGCFLCFSERSPALNVSLTHIMGIGFLNSSAGSSSNRRLEEIRNVQNEAQQSLLTNLLCQTLS